MNEQPINCPKNRFQVVSGDCHAAMVDENWEVSPVVGAGNAPEVHETAGNYRELRGRRGRACVRWYSSFP